MAKTPLQKYRAKVKRKRKEADRAFQEFCLKDKPYCRAGCGKKATEAHHHIPKSKSNAIRYDVKNGVPLCYSCHFKLENGEPTIYDNYAKYIDREYLQANRDKPVKISLQFYQDAINNLENQSKNKKKLK